MERTWKDFLSEEKSSQAIDSAQKEQGGVASTVRKGLVATVASRVRRRKDTVINKEDLVNVRVYSVCICVRVLHVHVLA